MCGKIEVRSGSRVWSGCRRKEERKAGRFPLDTAAATATADNFGSHLALLFGPGCGDTVPLSDRGATPGAVERKVADLTVQDASGNFPLPAAWFDRPAEAVAPELIGALVVLRGCGGIVTETEAYGPDDPASHSYPGPTKRNAAMFGQAGHAYVYRSYGLHWCLNVVCASGHAVLLRAIEPRQGLAEMARRRGTENRRVLTTGPGRLGQALGIGPADDHAPFHRPDFGFFRGEPVPVVIGPRIGISRAIEAPLRFGLAGSSYLSRPFQ